MTTASHQSANGEHYPMGPLLSGLRVVMLGRQGSGKGTQGVQFARLAAGWLGRKTGHRTWTGHRTRPCRS